MAGFAAWSMLCLRSRCPCLGKTQEVHKPCSIPACDLLPSFNFLETFGLSANLFTGNIVGLAKVTTSIARVAVAATPRATTVSIAVISHAVTRRDFSSYHFMCRPKTLSSKASTYPCSTFPRLAHVTMKQAMDPPILSILQLPWSLLLLLSRQLQLSVG